MPRGRIKIEVETALEDHKVLKERVGELSRFVEQPRPPLGEKGSHTWAAGLTERLVGLHDLLFRHFRHEEQSRIFEELAEQHPNHAAGLESLKSDHGKMLTALRDLTSASLTYSEGTAPGDPRLRRRVEEFLRQAGEHERRETELFQDLHLTDIGRGS